MYPERAGENSHLETEGAQATIGGLWMDYDPVFSQKSGGELSSCLIRYAEEHELHIRAAAELSRREKAAEDKLSRAIFWSRLAAVLALPGALYTCWKILLYLRDLTAGLPVR